MIYICILLIIIIFIVTSLCLCAKYRDEVYDFLKFIRYYYIKAKRIIQNKPKFDMSNIKMGI